MKIEVTTITVKAGEITLKLTPEEARRLRDALDNVVGRPFQTYIATQILPGYRDYAPPAWQSPNTCGQLTCLAG